MVSWKELGEEWQLPTPFPKARMPSLYYVHSHGSQHSLTIVRHSYRMNIQWKAWGFSLTLTLCWVLEEGKVAPLVFRELCACFLYSENKLHYLVAQLLALSDHDIWSRVSFSICETCYCSVWINFISSSVSSIKHQLDCINPLDFLKVKNPGLGLQQCSGLLYSTLGDQFTFLGIHLLQWVFFPVVNTAGTPEGECQPCYTGKAVWQKEVLQGFLKAQLMCGKFPLGLWL